MRLQRHTAAAIVKQFGEDGDDQEVICNIAGWRNHDKSGQYLTVELSPRFVSRASTDDEDVIDSIVSAREDIH